MKVSQSWHWGPMHVACVTCACCAAACRAHLVVCLFRGFVAWVARGHCQSVGCLFGVGASLRWLFVWFVFDCLLASFVLWLWDSFFDLFVIFCLTCCCLVGWSFVVCIEGLQGIVCCTVVVVVVVTAVTSLWCLNSTQHSSKQEPIKQTARQATQQAID